MPKPVWPSFTRPWVCGRLLLARFSSGPPAVRACFSMTPPRADQRTWTIPSRMRARRNAWGTSLPAPLEPRNASHRNSLRGVALVRRSRSGVAAQTSGPSGVAVTALAPRYGGRIRADFGPCSPACQLAALRFTPFRSATVDSFLSAAFSSLRLVVKSRTISSRPSSSAHAIRVP